MEGERDDDESGDNAEDETGRVGDAREVVGGQKREVLPLGLGLVDGGGLCDPDGMRR